DDATRAVLPTVRRLAVDDELAVLARRAGDCRGGVRGRADTAREADWYGAVRDEHSAVARAAAQYRSAVRGADGGIGAVLVAALARARDGRVVRGVLGEGNRAVVRAGLDLRVR